VFPGAVQVFWWWIGSKGEKWKRHIGGMRGVH